MMVTFLIIILICALAGLLSGLFGIGGGIVLVPLYYFILTKTDLISVPNFLQANKMNIAIATSLMSIIFSSSLSFVKHLKFGKVDFAQLSTSLPWVALGAVSGSFILYYIDGAIMKIFFAIFLLILAIYKLFWQRNFASQRTLNPQVKITKIVKIIVQPLIKNLLFFIAAILLGLLSVLLGIGGGLLGVIYLQFRGLKIHNAISTASCYGIVISLLLIGKSLFSIDIGTVKEFWIGYIYLPLSLLSIIPILVFVPIGVRLSHRLDERLINFLFATYLLLTSLVMLYTTLDGLQS